MEKKVSILQLVGTTASLMIVLVGAIINFHVKVAENSKDIQLLEETKNMEYSHIKESLSEIKENNRHTDRKLDEISIKIEGKKDKE